MCRPRHRTSRRSTGSRPVLKVLLTHTPQSRAQYYGDRGRSCLQAIAPVKLHEWNDVLDAAGLIEAVREVDILVAHRHAAGSGEILPPLHILLTSRCTSER